jgi:hypothetical protein
MLAHCRTTARLNGFARTGGLRERLFVAGTECRVPAGRCASGTPATIEAHEDVPDSRADERPTVTPTVFVADPPTLKPAHP